MSSGIYFALSGSVGQEKKLDSITNNLANVSTIAFKSDSTVFESFMADKSIHKGVGNQVSKNGESVKSFNTNSLLPSFVIVSAGNIDYSQGILQQTGNDMDVGIDGRGFFIVETPQGEMFSRDGHFKIGSDGTLQTSNGYSVLGIDNEGNYSPLTIVSSDKLSDSNKHMPSLNNGRLSISEDGTVALQQKNNNGTNVERLEKGKIILVDFEDETQLEKAMTGLYKLKNSAETGQFKADGILKQGFLEQSNVNAIKEMVRMITATRSVESYEKIMQSYDEMDKKVIEKVGGQV